jgi:predicted transcriptional regulator
MATLTIKLPDELAKAVEALGLLKEHAVIDVFEDAVERQQAIEDFFEAADALAALDLPEMSSDEIQAIIAETRASGRAGRP